MKNQKSNKGYLCRTIGLILLVSLTAGVGHSFGQVDSTSSDVEDFSLQDLLNVKVTTASKTEQSLEMAPATAYVISREQIRIRGYQSLLDVMHDLPDMKVDDKIYSGTRNTFTLRGIEGMEKMVILLDGVRISSPSGEVMPIMENYPVHLAEQIEVVYGPASALYGAYAASCVINIITRKDLQAKDIIVDASSAVGTYGYTNNTLYVNKRISDRMNFVVSGQYYYDQGVDYSKLYKEDSLLNVDHYSTGNFNSIYGPMAPSTPVSAEYEAPMKAYNLHAAFYLDDFVFSFFRNDFTVPTGFGNNTHNTIYNKEVFMRQSIDVADATYRKTIGKFTTTTSLTASQYNLHPSSNYRNLYTNMEPAYKYSTCSMVKGEEQLDYKVNDKWQLTGGGSYESYNVIPQSTDLDEPVDTKGQIKGTYLGTKSHYQPDGLPAVFYYIRFHNIGTYIQAQYSPLSSLNVTVGTRYDVNSRYGETVNPRLGVAYKPFDKTTIKVLYGSAFIAPNASSSYIQYGSFNTQDSGKTYHSYFLHLPNPDLKPITSQNFELSVRQYITRNISVTAQGYYTILTGLHAFADDNETTMQYNNMFNGIPVDYVEVFVNQSRQKNYGGGLQLDWKWLIGRFKGSTYASISYVDGVVDNALTEEAETEPDKELAFISSFMMRIGTDVKTGKFSFSPRLIIIGEQNLPGIGDTTTTIWQRQTIPGYALLNVSLRYDVVKHLSVFVNVTNALNQKYRSVGYNMDLTNTQTELLYGQPQDPIRIVGGLNLNF
jgi:outer membrane cobalamin receptor